jgi:pyruvate dehydrogenase E2 component (dihydrolipoamide acetyltransferase)
MRDVHVAYLVGGSKEMGSTHGWRKLAVAGWKPPINPQFFGDLEIDAGALIDYIDQVRCEVGVRITMTHLIIKATAHGLAAVPELRVRLARGRMYPREGVDVFVIVATESGQELTGIKIHDADRKSVVEIAQEMNQRYAALEAGHDPELGRSKALLSHLPPRAVRAALNLAAWLTSDLNLNLGRIGMPRQAFGGAMISSVGMWGISHGYAPLAPYHRVPLLLLIGAVQRKPVAVEDEVVVRPMLTLTATFDHRYADGFHAAQFAEAVHTYCETPARFGFSSSGGAESQNAP